MKNSEQLLHYSRGLRTRTRVKVERLEASTAQEAMVIADKIDDIFRNDP